MSAQVGSVGVLLPQAVEPLSRGLLATNWLICMLLCFLQEFNKGLFDYLIATDDVHGAAADDAAAAGGGKQQRRKGGGGRDKGGKRKKDEEFGVTRGIDFKVRAEFEGQRQGGGLQGAQPASLQAVRGHTLPATAHVQSAAAAAAVDACHQAHCPAHLHVTPARSAGRADGHQL